jgi:hypothetical protein
MEPGCACTQFFLSITSFKKIEINFLHVRIIFRVSFHRKIQLYVAYMNTKCEMTL